MAEEANVILRPLIGTDEANIDDKGRILFSKKKRDRLGEPFAICVGDVGCLVAYPQSEWLRKVSDMLAYDSLNQGRQQFTRLFLGESDDELKFDQQGRVVIPHKMRTVARLKDKVLLVGCGDRVEIWAKEEYERFQEDTETYGLRRREALAKAHGQMVGRL